MKSESAHSMDGAITKDTTANEREIAGRFRQCIIMFWKNSLLFRRNVWGTLAEIFMAFLFALIILLLRYFVDVTVYPDQSSTNGTTFISYNPLLGLFDAVNASNLTNIYFYPNNSFIQEIVTNAYTLINTAKPNFTATCKLHYLFFSLF